MTIGLATDGSAATTRDAILLVPEHEDPIRIDDWGSHSRGRPTVPSTTRAPALAEPDPVSAGPGNGGRRDVTLTGYGTNSWSRDRLRRPTPGPLRQPSRQCSRTSWG